MTADLQLSVTFSNFTAILANKGISGKLMK